MERPEIVLKFASVIWIGTLNDLVDYHVAVLLFWYYC